MRSNSSDSFERENLQQARKKRCNKIPLSMVETMVQEAQILDQHERDAAKLNDERQHEITRLNDQHERNLTKDAQEV